MSARFQTFAYNSRTVWSNYMKFWQQFEINEFYVCTKFRGNRSRDFGFMTRKPPRKFGVKSGLSQKRLKYGKKYFSWLYVLRYPFIPTNPLSAAMRFFSYFFPFFSFFFPFFSFFFFLNLVRSSSPKPQHIEILFLCEVVEVHTQLCLLKFFLGQLPRETPPKWGPKKSIFWTAQARVPVFLDISRYLRDKYFDIIWGYHSPRRPPPNGPPQKQIFLTI